MKTPQEIATATLGKEPTLPEERAIWDAVVAGVQADRDQRETVYLTGSDWTVEHREHETLGVVTALALWPAGAAGLTEEPVAILALTAAGVDALVGTLNPGA